MSDTEKTNVNKPLFVNAGACLGCGYCEAVCPTGAIRVDGYAKIDAARCIGCASCAGRCPTGAIN